MPDVHHFILVVTLQSRLISQLSKQGQKEAKVSQLGERRTEIFLLVLLDSRTYAFPFHCAVVAGDKLTLNVSLIPSNLYVVLCGH